MLAALSPVCLLGMLAAHQQREKAMEFGRSSLLATARLAVTRQEQLLVKTQNLLQVMASGSSIRDTRIRLCEPYLRNLRAQYLMYVNIGVANLEGQLTCHAQNDGEPVNVADRPYFVPPCSTRPFRSVNLASAGDRPAGAEFRLPGLW